MKLSTFLLSASLFTIGCGKNPASRTVSSASARNLGSAEALGNIIASPTSSSDRLGSAHLTSVEGVGVELSYIVENLDRSSNKPDYITRVKTLDVSVQSRGLQPTDKLQVVIVNRVHTEGSCGFESKTDEYIYQLPLREEGIGVFKAELIGEGTILWGIGDQRKPESANLHLPVLDHKGYCSRETSEALELALVVNGQWQTDPISGSHNFKLDLRN